MTAITGKSSTAASVAFALKRSHADLNLDTSTGGHKYWRLYIDDNNGDATYTMVEELRLYDVNDLTYVVSETTSPTPVDPIDYFINSSQDSSSYAADHPFILNFSDGFSTSFVHWRNETNEGPDGVWVGLVFLEEQDIQRYTLIQTGLDSPDIDAAPTAFRLQYSDDGVQWFNRHIGSASWPAVEATAATFDDYVYDFFLSIANPINGSGTLGLLSGVGVGAAEIPPAPVDSDYAGDIYLPLLSLSGDGAETTQATNSLPSFTATGQYEPGNIYGNIFPVEIPQFTATGQVASDGFITTGVNALGKLTATGTGYQYGDATGIVLPSLTLTSAGFTGGVGTAIINLPKLSIDVAGYQEGDQYGAGLPSFSATGVGTVGAVGTLSQTLPSLQMQANATDGLLPALTATGTMSVGVGLYGEITLPALAIQSDATEGQLPALTITAAGVAGQAGQAAATLPPISGLGSARDAALPAITLVAAGFTGGIGYGELTLPSFSATSNASLLTLPSFSISASGFSGGIAYGAITLPSLGASGGNDGTNELPALTITGNGVAGVPGTVDVTLPSLTGVGGLQDATLPSLSVTGSGVQGSVGEGILYLPSLSITGDILNGSISAGGVIDVALPALSATSNGLTGNAYAGTAALGRLSIATEGAFGRVGTGSIILPIFSMSAEGHGEYNATALITLPMLNLVATGPDSSITNPVVVGSVDQGQVMSMNLAHKGVTLFDNYGYNSFADFNGVQLAASSQGIFAITGDTDNGNIIQASIQLGKLDFDNQQLKNVDYAHVGYRADGDLEILVTADDGTEYTYTLSERGVDERHTARVRMGKGVKGRYWSTKIQNVAGSDFRIDSIDLMERVSKRRVK